MLCSAPVVGFAEVAEVVGALIAAERVAHSVVALEPGAGGAPCAVGPAPGAAQAVAFEHGALDGAGDGRTWAAVTLLAECIGRGGWGLRVDVGQGSVARRGGIRR